MISAAESQAHILVVDDEPMLAWTIGTLLSKAGYAVVTLNNPLQVPEELRRRPAKLVISDVIMPDLSGIDLAKQLHSEHPDCKIILLSGQAATVDLLEKCRAEGYNFEVFPKPIKPADFLQMVRARMEAV